MTGVSDSLDSRISGENDLRIVLTFE